MTQANQEQIDYWNGNAGDQWVRAQEHLDALLQPLSIQALATAAVAGHERVLDVGCGCGATSLQLADSSAHVTGVDVSAPMIGRAQERAAGRDNVIFVQADASVWRAPEPCQLLFSRFGVMFFEDPTTAFRNLHRSLSADGRLCFLCWRAPADNPWLAVPSAAAQPFLPEAAPTDGPNPFAFADTEFVSSMLLEAGFRQPQFALCEAALTLGTDMAEAIDFLTRIGPLSRVIAELAAPEQELALAAVRQALEPYRVASGVQLGASAWIVTAAA